MHTSSSLDVRPTIGNTMLVAAFPGTGKSHYCNVDVDYMPQDLQPIVIVVSLIKPIFPKITLSI